MFSIRKRAIFLSVTWILLFSLTLTFLDYLSNVFNSNVCSQTIASLSWAGYIVSPHASGQEIEVNEVSASWIVPRVNVSSGDGYSSMWVGIGGQTDKTLIQVGTEHDSVGGSEVYSAWYEMLPNYAIKIQNIDISPGDKVVASVTLLDIAQDQWHIKLVDITKNQEFNLKVDYNSSRSSAEWIVERPTINNRISTIVDFGDATFSECKVKVNNTCGAIGNFTYSKVQMTNQQATILTAISPLNIDGASFTASYIPN